jgi:hypothetical protein
MTFFPVCVQDIPVWLTMIVAEAQRMEDVEGMYVLRRDFDALRPEIMTFVRSCSGEMILEDALEPVAQYLRHREPNLEAAALEAIEWLRLLLRQPGLCE